MSAHPTTVSAPRHRRSRLTMGDFQLTSIDSSSAIDRDQGHTHFVLATRKILENVRSARRYPDEVQIDAHEVVVSAETQLEQVSFDLARVHRAN